MSGTLVPAAGTSLWFVVPAWKRYDLSAVTFDMFKYLTDTLKERGMDAHALVVADDHNLDIARVAGLDTLEHENQLGAKLNAGYRYATDMGADYVCPVGSDTWLHPDAFHFMPGPNTILCTRNYTCVDATGDRQTVFRVGYDGGAGSRVIPVDLLASVGFEPLEPGTNKGCDGQTLAAIRRKRDVALVYTDISPFQVVGFQSSVQVSSYDNLIDRWGVDQHEPFQGLYDHFPAELVDRMTAVYAARTEPAYA